MSQRNGVADPTEQMIDEALKQSTEQVPDRLIMTITFEPRTGAVGVQGDPLLLQNKPLALGCIEMVKHAILTQPLKPIPPTRAPRLVLPN